MELVTPSIQVHVAVSITTIAMVIRHTSPNVQCGNPTSMLTIKNKNEVIYIRLDNLLYIQADGNYCNIYLVDGGVINTLSFQRAEIARMMDEQLTKECRKQFVLLGRSYLINTNFILRIQPSKHLLTFSTNRFGTCSKTSIKATSKALYLLLEEIEKESSKAKEM